MSQARPHHLALLLAASLLVFVTATPDANAACNATCRRDVARCTATQCKDIGSKACRRRCKPVAIRTLAYALSECRMDAAGSVIAHQTLRIRRADREPITVAEFSSSGPVADPQSLCLNFGLGRWGSSSVVMFPLQRLGVSPDGSGIVFEVNQEFSIAEPFWLSPAQEGMFFVRSDGSGLRYLGPPSRDRSFRIGQDFLDGPKEFRTLWILSPPMLFSPNGRWIAFTDVGPGPDGKDAVQIFVLDLMTSPTPERRQVTHLPSGTETAAFEKAAPYLLTCCPKFIDDRTILFQTSVDADGSNPEENFTAFTIRIDGSNLKPVPTPVALPDSHLVPSFAVTGLGRNLARLSLPDSPVNKPPDSNFKIAEVFLQDGKNLLQLTKFHRVDTFPAFLNPTRTRAFFLASANPPAGTNPEGVCQLFSINTVGGGLRQVTHFDRQVCPWSFGPGCFQVALGYGFYRVIFQDPTTQAVVFDSPCDPLRATNPFGYQLFAMRPDGHGLRQLTDASGLTHNPDGGITVELPGPFAYSAEPH